MDSVITPISNLLLRAYPFSQLCQAEHMDPMSMASSVQLNRILPCWEILGSCSALCLSLGCLMFYPIFKSVLGFFQYHTSSPCRWPAHKLQLLSQKSLEPGKRHLTTRAMEFTISKSPEPCSQQVLHQSSQEQPCCWEPASQHQHCSAAMTAELGDITTDVHPSCYIRPCALQMPKGQQSGRRTWKTNSKPGGVLSAFSTLKVPVMIFPLSRDEMFVSVEKLKCLPPPTHSCGDKSPVEKWAMWLS